MSQSETAVGASRYGSRYPSSAENVRDCPVCGAGVPSTRAMYCSVACKQRAFRRRHQRPVIGELAVVHQQLERQRQRVAHTIYECPRCEERYVGERRCSACQLYCKALGLGGQCEECDHIMLLAELLGT
jgi:hypothetical protein